MQKYCCIFFVFIALQSQSQSISIIANKLLKAYPESIKAVQNNRIVFKDGSSLPLDDGRKDKTFQQLLDEPDIEDQFVFPYTSGTVKNELAKNFDPGRIRNEAFFKKLYGSSKQEVESQLVEIVWCPKLVGKKIKVTRANNAFMAFESLSKELDEHPEFLPYLKDIAGTFNWRNISGTNRLSMHSFGMTIDINTQQSHYWQWDCKCTNEEASLGYHNTIPLELVSLFEKHGFIWGGKWYHYDTMHFEYRPELF